MPRVDEKLRKQNLFEHGFGTEMMRIVTICRNCGSLELTAMLRCSKCGSVLPKKSLYAQYKEQHQNCERCGTVLSDRMVYCPHCGTAVKKR